MTIESLPPENSSAGRSNSPATSRKMCIASDSSMSRCVSGGTGSTRGPGRTGRPVGTVRTGALTTEPVP